MNMEEWESSAGMGSERSASTKLWLSVLFVVIAFADVEGGGEMGRETRGGRGDERGDGRGEGRQKGDQCRSLATPTHP